MKSKTSCFNKTIFKKNFTHYWPLWFCWLGYLLLELPFSIWFHMSQQLTYDRGNSLEENALYAMADSLSVSISPIPVFVIAVAAAMALFSYLYNARAANMVHAFPVDRRELYVTNYISGLIFLLVPEFLTFISSVLVCAAQQITCMQYLLQWFLYIAGVTFFAYSLAVFVAMFTGWMGAIPVYYLIVNYLYVGVLFVVNQMIYLVTYGIVDGWNPGKSSILSPLYYLNNNLRVTRIFEEEKIAGIGITGGKLVVIYAVAAIFIATAAYRLYQRRRIESAGDFISIGAVKPVFRWGVALCGGFTVSTAITTLLYYELQWDVFPCLVAGIVLFGFVGFFLAEMLLQKSFRVFKKWRFAEWGVFTVTALLLVILFRVDAFGIARYVPEEEEIATAFVDMDYPIEVAPEQVPELLELHRKAIADKKFYQQNAKGESGYYMTTFTYYLKDGTKKIRRYPIPIEEIYVTDTNEPAGKILSWEREPENLKRQILGRDYANNKYSGGNFECYDEKRNMDTKWFGRREINAIVDAIIADIEAGNFEKYYIYSTRQDDDIYGEEYVNGLYLEYLNPNGIYNNWEYYHEFGNEPEQSDIIVEHMASSNYISFGAECTNLIETLKRLDLVNDTWKLITNEEYDEMMK